MSLTTLDVERLEIQLFGAKIADSLLKFTDTMILAMVGAGAGISDLIFSPGRPPQVEQYGELTAVAIDGVPMLETEQTAQVARDLIEGNEHALRTLSHKGACDLSGPRRLRALPRQHLPAAGSYAIVMRVIAMQHPVVHRARTAGLAREDRPAQERYRPRDRADRIGQVVDARGDHRPDERARADHIITIEDPIEFLHTHKKATIHQRELHSDTPTFALALRAALRQAPKVILVGEMRDRETIEIALTAAETGHLVLSTLHTIDASKTVERIVGVFPVGDQRRDPHAAVEVVSIHHLAASGAENRGRADRGARDSEVDASHARLHRAG